MRYVSIDIETSGLNPEAHNVIEFGAVVDDMVTPINDLPRFHRYVVQDSYCCQAGAIAMNKDIFEILSKYDKNIPMKAQEYPFTDNNLLISEFITWLVQNNVICSEENPETFTVAGKNFFGFDLHFIRKLSFGHKLRIKHRGIDPGTLYWNPFSDNEIPDLQECLRRAGIDEIVTHTSVEDALCVVKLVRSRYGISLS